MGIIERIRNQPRQARVRLVWIICIAVFVLLLALWIFTSKIGKPLPKDTSLFKTLYQGAKDVKDSYQH